ncbi:bifunctional 2-polyprenyl-6-hydroxyphenol methylase/3-demethylubiquinol 3-O-methyltransferase UbiG [Alphaproteobacteria bacterium]|nr:bifunctional 2-polyprenyl-6-hydroxyphenol methylase/3-demethylubiquinol 3-O-methyltransferase UbiG [Alphaproteobacteria bacterium]
MTNTVDKREIEQFSSLSNRWWDKSGPFAALHKMSNARIEFIKLNASRITNKIHEGSKSLHGISCLDVGCGGGILSEPLTRLGAKVTGIDASKTAIQVAKEHALRSRLKINYKCITTSELLSSNQTSYLNKFDIVIASEVIEHVIDKKIFLSDISRLSRPGGIIIFTSINNSFPGIVMGKYFAENIIKVVPKNTHDPQKFISPNQLAIEAEKYGVILDSFVGFRPTFKFQNILNKEFGDFKLSSNLSINYGAAGINLKTNDHLESKENL